MLENSKLTFVLESLMTRYRIGSFLVGDQIKFLDDITSHKSYKNLPVETQEILADIISQEKSGDVIVKIAGLNSTPWLQGTPEASPLSFDIGIDGGGGRYLTMVTLPGDLISQIKRVDPGVNMPETIAPNLKISYDNNTNSIELGSEDEETEDGLVPNKVKVPKMPTKDTKITNKKPVETDYTSGIKSKLDIDNTGSIDTKSKA